MQLNPFSRKHLYRAWFLLALAGSSSVAAPATDTWLRITTPDFELYTTAGEKTGRDVIRYFEQVRGFFEKASPVRTPAGFPVRIIAFSNREQFAAYSPNSYSVAFFAGGAKRDYIVMADASPESYSIAIHEYVHLIVRHSGLRLPVWLNEGLADVYSSMRPVRDGVAVGDLIPARMQMLGAAPWLDFNSLTSVDSKSPIYKEGERTGTFYAESWALTHMLFLAPDYKDQFGKLVSALHSGKSASEACQIAYGKSGEAVFQDLRSYFKRKKMYGTVFNASFAKADQLPVVEQLSAFDARLMLADLQTGLQRFDSATTEYLALSKEKPDNLDVMQSLGYLALAKKDVASAARYFGEAYDAGSADPQMCLALAELRVRAGQPPEKTIEVLKRAVAAHPGFTDALIPLGLIEASADQYQAAIQTLMSIRNVTPERAAALFTTLAYAYLETGDLDKARAQLANARKWAHNAEEQKKVEDVARFVEARSKMPSPPRANETLESIDGVIQSVDCSSNGNRIHVLAGQKGLTLLLPSANTVEFTSRAGTTAELACGPQHPFVAHIGYVPDIAAGADGVVRKLSY